MELIRSGDTRVFECLGNQCVSDSQLRLNKYCISHTIDDGVLLFNGITNELVIISKGDESSFIESEYARRHWFTVPHAFDEQKLIIQLRHKFEKVYAEETKITKYTIFTTTMCNANCYYCFENGQRSNALMTEDVSHQLVRRIIANSSKNDLIELAWFGGEPLLNTSVIEYICAELKKNKVNYFSTMASNAFLFTPSIIAKAKDIWNLRYMQVTLDGTAEYYNKIKNYSCNGQINAFQLVLENIKCIIKSGIFVVIKLNISQNNKDDLLDLIDQLARIFNRTDLIGIHCACLFGTNVAGDIATRIDQSRELNRAQLEVMEKIERCGLYRFGLLPHLRIHNCNPDAGREITILPDGRIGWCEHYLGSNFIGDIYSDILDCDKINFFKIRYDDLEECQVCSVYPNCIRLKICNACTEWCTAEKRSCLVRETQMQMNYEYALYRKKHK